MNSSQQILDIVRSIHKTRDIEPEIVFQAIESGILQALAGQFGDASGLSVAIDRETGDVQALRSGEPISPDDVFYRDDSIEPAMQAAAEILREAEKIALLAHYRGRVGGIVFAESSPKGCGELMIRPGRVDCQTADLERVPGERFRPGESIACQILGAAIQGGRVQVQLSRTRPGLVKGLFRHFIAKIADGSIVIQSIAREPGYRSKVAMVSSSGESCVDACLGENGEWIMAICNQLGGEKIDLIDWQAGMEANVAAALKPASVDKVHLFPIPGKALAILEAGEIQRANGRGGKNLLLASKLCGWDICLATAEQWDADRALSEKTFLELGIAKPEPLVAAGIYTCDELSVVEPADLMRICEIDEETASNIIAQTEERSGF